MKKEKIVQMFDEYNSKLNPSFTEADKEHIVRFCEEVVKQLYYEEAMNNQK